MHQGEMTKIALVGGGSGGHITPLYNLARAVYRLQPTWQLIYIGDRPSLKQWKSFLPEPETEKFQAIVTGKIRRYDGITGWSRLKLWRSYLLNVRDLFLIILGCLQGFFILLRHRPTVIFSKGGVSALGVCISGVLLNIPIVTHDSDATSSLTHRLISRYVSLHLTGTPLETYSDRHKYVGIPIAETLKSPIVASEASRIRKLYKIPESTKLLLVIGGGHGAKSVNRGVLEVLQQLEPNETICCCIVTGRGKYQEAKKISTGIKNPKIDILLVEFSPDIPALLQLSTWVITRAGATALAEIAAAKKPAIIIPNPILPAGHQVHNAKRYEGLGAGVIVHDTGDQVDVPELLATLNRLTTDDGLCQKLSNNIAKLAVYDASDRIVHAIKGLKQ